MIISRSPLRISLGGGGTDLPSYYREFGGFLIAAAIDKAIYVCVHRTFLDEMVVRYSKIERVQHRTEVRHPIIREALDLLQINERNIDITSLADIPAGTGLGSSGSFGTALHQGAVPLSQQDDHAGRGGRDGLSHRDRSSPRASGQAGPVCRRPRRSQLL